MKFTLYRPTDLSDELWTAYTQLRDARPIYDDPFFDPEYARLVGEVREDTRIGVAFDGDQAVAFWALHKRPGNWARPIGGPFSDWHAPIVEKGRTLCPNAFLAGLGLSGFSAFGYKPIPECPNPGMDRVGANMTDLSMGWDTYMAEQDAYWPKHFKKMRRLYRNVERDFSSLNFSFDNREGTALSRLIELKRAQFQRTGYHDVLQTEWAKGLLDRLWHHESPRLRLRLVTLYYDDKHAASELNLQSDKVMHGWLTGFEQEMGNYSPGNMLVQEMLQRMCVENILTYDAGPGLDHYKRNYANYQLPIETGTLRGIRGSYAPSRIAGRMWRYGERTLTGKPSHLMGRARRRMDQIALSELNLGARLKGAYSALTTREL